MQSPSQGIYCTYFRDGYCKFGEKCRFSHDKQQIERETKVGAIYNDFRVSSPSYYELAVEEEIVAQTMGPNWQRACIEMKTSLESLMSIPLIHIIIDYYGLAPVMENIAAYFSPNKGSIYDDYEVTKWPLGKSFNSCFICNAQFPEDELILAFHRCISSNEIHYNSVKMRKFCRECWPFSAGDLRNNRLIAGWTDKRKIKWEFGKPVPQNKATRAAFLCVDYDWRFYKASDCEWLTRKKGEQYVIKNALRWIGWI